MMHGFLFVSVLGAASATGREDAGTACEARQDDEKKFLNPYDLETLSAVVTQAADKYKTSSGYTFKPLEKVQFMKMAEPIFNNKEAKKSCYDKEISLKESPDADAKKAARKACCMREFDALEEVLGELGTNLHKSSMIQSLTETEKKQFVKFCKGHFKYLLQDPKFKGFVDDKKWAEIPKNLKPKLETAKEILLQQIKDKDTSVLAGYIAEADPTTATQTVIVDKHDTPGTGFDEPPDADKLGENVQKQKEYLAFYRMAKPVLTAIFSNDITPSYQALKESYDQIVEQMKAVASTLE